MPVEITGAPSQNYKLQIGKETTWGTEVNATARLLGDGRLRDTGTALTSDRAFGLMAARMEQPVLVSGGAGLDFESELSYEQILHILSAAVQSPSAPSEQTSDQDDYLWVFESPVSDPPSVDSFTLEGVARAGGSNIEEFTAVGAIVSDFSISATFGNNLSQIAATWMAKDIESKAPTSDPGIPLRRLIPTGLWTVKIADTQAGLGAAPVIAGAVNSFDLSITNGMFLAQRLSGTTAFTGVKAQQYEGTLEIVMDLLALTETERTKFRAGDRRFIRLSVEGAQIGTGENHRITVDVSAFLLESPDDGDESGQITKSLTYEIAHDPTWGFGYKFEVVNSLETLP